MQAERFLFRILKRQDAMAISEKIPTPTATPTIRERNETPLVVVWFSFKDIR